MTRLNITMDDQIADYVRQLSGDDVSAWIARACRDAILRHDSPAIAAWESRHSDPEWDAQRDRELFG